jgi:type I restriction enzyme S subunit
MEQIDALTTEAQHAIDLLQERRAALISAAVTGQIDVRGLVEHSASQVHQQPA